MSLDFVVSTIFKSKDQTSQAFDKMTKNAKQFGNASEKAFKKANKGASSFAATMKGVLAAGVIQSAFSSLGQGLSTVAGEFIEFDQAITSASAKFKGLDLSTKAGQKTLEALGKTARQVAAETKFSAGEAAAGLEFYATAGFDAATSMKLLKPTASFATAANLDLARASDIASDAMGIFSMNTGSATEIQEKFRVVSDQMSKTMNSTNTSAEEMFEAMKQGGVIYTQSGQKMSTFNTLLGTLAENSLKGSQAGTSLRAIMARLAKPTGEAQEAMNKLGIKTRDGEGNFKDMFDILGDFEKGLGGMGDAQKLAATKTIFGEEAMAAFSIIMKKGNKGLREYRKSITDSAGATKKMADIMGNSLGNKLASMKSAAIELGFKLFDAFGKQGSAAIDMFTGAIRNFDMQPIIDGIKFVVDMGKKMINRFTEISETTGLFDKVKNAVAQMKPVFETIIDVVSTLWDFLDNTGILKLLSIVLGRLVDNVALMAKAFQFMWKIVKPIIELMGKMLKPIVEAINFIAENKELSVEQKIENQTGAISGTSSVGVRGRSTPSRVPPNQVEVEARQSVALSGKINIAGAPEGSTAEIMGAPGLQTEMTGPEARF